MKKTFYTFGLAALATLTSFAKTTKSAADSTKPEEAKFVASGYIDSYYNYGFNKPKSGNTMGIIPNSGGATNYMRAFDRLTNQFSLGLVQTKFTYTNAKSEMVIDLAFGPNADLGNFGNTLGGVSSFTPSNPNQKALYGTGAVIKQAYFNYKFTDKLSMTVGQFGTHIGYEVIDAPVNYHYSLSNLFNNGPFYHVGAKMNYAVTENFGVMAGVVNNWDAMSDWKTQKSVIGQIYVKPTEGFNVYLNYIGGHNDDPFKVGKNSQSNATPAYNVPFSYNRQLLDLVAGYQVTEKFYVGANAAYGQYDASGDSASKAEFKDFFAQDKTTLPWYGVALYSNYAVSSMFGIGARYEHFNDKYKVRYANTVVNALTITMPITLASGHVIIKPEFRTDVSPDEVFESQDKFGATNSRRNQSTIGLSFIYKY